ncbi:MAG TPA: rhomboid family intramembrane serine protease [Puia sp.]|jgi:membrane associated rhomboid family serine protease
MNAQTRLKLIYLPFLALALIIIGGYTLLHWLLFIKLHIFSLNEEIINLWIPIFLPFIPVYLWLRPRISLLKLKTKKSDLPGLYIFIAAFAIATPTLIAQHWVQTASGKLTLLDNIDHITDYEATKYYTLAKFYVDRSHPGTRSRFVVSGKHNESFNMKLYIVLPILSSPADTANSNCKAWYGIKYDRTISNRLTQQDKQQLYSEFVDFCQKTFDTIDLSRFIYLNREGSTDDYKGYKEAIKNNTGFDHNMTNVLVPVNAPFESRNGNKFPWIFASFAIGAVVWLIMILIPKLDETRLNEFNSGAAAKSADLKWLTDLLLPREGYFITPVIMHINILIFIIMVLAGLGFVSFDGPGLLAWGANYRPAVSNGQWWRLCTSMFLHSGIMHLAANMYGLVLAGILLEPRLGKTKYAIVYLTTGILAGIASLWWHPVAISVGASGAIFGLYGVLLALILAKVYPKEFSKSTLLLVLIFVGYSLLMGLQGGIDNAAHIGGLIGGFVFGLLLATSLKEQIKTQEL